MSDSGLRIALAVVEECKREAPCPRDEACRLGYLARGLTCPSCIVWPTEAELLAIVEREEAASE